MARKAAAKTKPRAPLTRERVLRAAITLADEGGVEALSMRKLADALGVKAMSLYNHVAGKDDVLDGIVDAAWAEIVAPGGDEDWKTAIRDIAISAHEMMLSHPWASDVSVRKPGFARLRYGDLLLGCFRNAGFSKDLTYHAYHIVESYIMGYTLQVLSYRAVDMTKFEDIVEGFRRGDFAADYPHFTEHALQHMEPDREDGSGGYELGLDLILDSLERLRDTA